MHIVSGQIHSLERMIWGYKWEKKDKDKTGEIEIADRSRERR